jgi:hypothetical protein
MTFNTEWLLGSQAQVEPLKKKGIWGLEEKDTESEIEHTSELSKQQQTYRIDQ